MLLSRSLLSRSAAFPALLALLPGLSKGAPQVGPEILLTTNPGLPTSEVAGLIGVQFSPDPNEGFEEVMGSPNGNWMVAGVIDDPASPGDFLDVLMVNGVLVLMQGDVAPWDPSGRVIRDIEFNSYDINDNGDYVFVVGLRAGNSGPTEEQVVRNVGGQFFVNAEVGAPISALPGASFGSRYRESKIHGDGTTAFMADNILGVPSLRDTAFFQSGSLLLQKGVTVPPGQANGGNATFRSTVGSVKFWVSEDAQHWALEADLNAASAIDEVFLVDGTVVLQSGSVIPGSGFTNPIRSNGIFSGFMDDGGNWYARGKNAVDDIAWIVRNGAVVAQEGAPVIPGSTEVVAGVSSSVTFEIISANSLGEFIYAADTDAVAPLGDEVLVRDGLRIVARIGTPLDLNQNGVFDDDAFIEEFTGRNGHLSDSGLYTLQVEVENAAGDTTGLAIVRFDTNNVEIGTAYCTANPNSTGTPSELSARGSTSVAANNVTLTASGLPPSQFGIFLNADERGFMPNIGGPGSGNLCLGGEIGRYVGPGQVFSSGPNGTFQLRLDLTSIPRPNAIEAAVPGQTWRFQAWYRDLTVNGPSSNLTRGLEIRLD